MQQVLSARQHAGCVFIRQVTQRHTVRIDPTTDVVSAAWRDVWKIIRGILTSFFFYNPGSKANNKQTQTLQ